MYIPWLFIEPAVFNLYIKLFLNAFQAQPSQPLLIP